MSSEPLPPDPNEQISPVPLGPSPGLPDETIPEVLPVQRRDRPHFAWIVIVAVVGLLITLRVYSSKHPKEAPEKPVAVAAEPKGLDASELQERFVIGIDQLSKKTGMKFDEELPDVKNQPAIQRIRFAVVIGETRGPAKALAALEAIQPPPNAGADEAQLRDILERLYRQYEKDDFSRSAISTKDEKFLKEKLGWLGELALNPQGAPNPEKRDTILSQTLDFVTRFMVLVLGMMLAGLAGLLSLLFLLIGASSGRLATKVQPPIVNGGLYAETFALWLVGFIIFSLAIGAVSAIVKLSPPVTILALGSPLILAHVALVWPVSRGVSWAQVRREIGLTTGSGFLTEIFAGVRCYFTALPLLAVGLIIMLFLMRLDTRITGSPPAPPTHPVQEMLANPAPLDLVCLFIVLSVIAPLCEETAFRGILYRHLREASWAWRTGLSFLFSATISSFIFAAIHPQGIFGVPLLMALAIAFCGARELRGSLIPSMVAHGINNGLVLLLYTVVA